MPRGDDFRKMPSSHRLAQTGHTKARWIKVSKGNCGAVALLALITTLSALLRNPVLENEERGGRTRLRP